MAMALKADIEGAFRKSGAQQPIDLVSLSSRTMGDRHLELEILTIFANQLPGYTSAIEASETAVALRTAAHMLKGAARGVGASRLAELAGELEEGDRSVLAQMREEADRVADYIKTLVT